MTPKKKSPSSIKERKNQVINKFEGFGCELYDQIEKREFPRVEMPSRSIYNIKYDQKVRQYILGNRMVRRSARNIRHIRPFTQLVWVADIVNSLSRTNKTSTLRDVYYMAQAYDMNFKDQQESDGIITDLETIVGYSREDFNVFPEERSAIYGNLTIEYTVPGYEGKRLNLTIHPDGVMIGPALTSAEFVKSEVDKILCIEKGAMFTRFIEEKAWQRFNALLIHTAGQAPRATRHIIRRLNKELGLPVYVLTDGDPWGMHIAMVIISGSVDYATPIVIRRRGIVQIDNIGRIIDECLEEEGYFVDSLGNEVSACTDFEVLTCDNDGKICFMPVTQVLRHRINEKLFRLLTETGREVLVTKCHSVFTLKDGKIVSVPTTSLKERDLLVIPKVANSRTNNAKEINVINELLKLPDDRLSRIFVKWEGNRSKWHQRRKITSLRRKNALKINKDVAICCKETFGRHPVNIPAILPLNVELSRLLGYYTSEGWISPKKNSFTNVNLTFGSHEQEVIQDAEECIKSSFGDISISKHMDDSATTLSFGGKTGASLFDALVGHGFNGKAVPQVFMNTQISNVMEYMKGCFGDGYVIYDHKGANAICWKMNNPALMPRLWYLLLRLGVLGSMENDTCLLVTGKEEKKKVASCVLHEDDKLKIKHRINRTATSCCRLPKAFPVIASNLYKLKNLFMQGRYHSKRCKYTYRRICEALRNNKEEGIQPNNLRYALRYIKKSKMQLTREENQLIDEITMLLNAHVAFDPIVKIECVEPTSSYVYDISVAGNERFIGGKGGILLHNSANAAHLRELTTPDAKWAGVWATDIVEYKLPSDRLTELDIKRLYELRKDPRYEGELWQREIETFLKIGKKAEQEAFSRYGLSYIVDQYLPTKLEEMESY